MQVEEQILLRNEILVPKDTRVLVEHNWAFVDNRKYRHARPLSAAQRAIERFHWCMTRGAAHHPDPSLV